MTDIKDGEDTVFLNTPWLVTRDAGRVFFDISEGLMKSTVSRRNYLKSCSELYEFFDAMQKKLERPSDSRIFPAIEYIETHYTEDTPVSELCKLCYMSEPHLFRLFKETTGYTPIVYRNRLRIERAKTLLAGGECGVGEAAALTGFTSIYYFDRVFKALTGVPPGKWTSM